MQDCLFTHSYHSLIKVWSKCIRLCTGIGGHNFLHCLPEVGRDELHVSLCEMIMGGQIEGVESLLLAHRQGHAFAPRVHERLPVKRQKPIPGLNTSRFSQLHAAW